MLSKPPIDKQILKQGIKELVTHELIDKQCDNFTIKPINAGTVNYNYFVADSTRQCLFKIFVNNDILPIDRLAVFNLQVELAIIGLAPMPLYLSQDGLYYCEQWLANSHTLLDEKNALTQCDNEKDANIKSLGRLAEALYSVHNSHISAPLLDLSAHLQAYWSQIKSPSQKLTQEYTEMLTFCDQYFKENRSDFVLCHNDLNMGHVCAQKGIIFDWEYAYVGCKYYDIVNCILINQFDEEQAKLLCAQYAQLIKQTPMNIYKAVQNVRKLADFTCKLWRYTIGGEPILE